MTTTLAPIIHPRLARAAWRPAIDPLIERRDGMRFTLDGSDALERHLAHTCAFVLAGVRTCLPEDVLDGLLLGGGYGRGEGGVLRTEQGEEPYNDLEFYVFVQGNPRLNERRHGAALHALAKKLSPAAGVEIEFKIVSLKQLARSPITMHYYDLVTGHRQLLGRSPLMADFEHLRMGTRIPLSEATRLMMNRCTGLLFAKERLQRRTLTAEDADFVGRNLAKARLALGDAVLTVYGQYNWSCCVRRQRLHRLIPDEPLPWLEDVKAHHEAGVGFKLHPRRTMISHTALEQQLAELTNLAIKVWLWLESGRLGVPFRSAYDYASSPCDKCPETSRWRNWIINLQLSGPEAFLAPTRFRYPREHLLNALALLLWERVEAGNDILSRVQRELHTTRTDYPGLVRTYGATWRMFN